jgi:hypothetical protein
VLIVGSACFALSPFVLAQSAPPKAYLLHVSEGQEFSDIGSDDKTKPEPVDPQDHSQGLKVAFDRGDSVGDRVSKVTDWKAFKTLHISVVNPSEKPVKLTLNVFHSGTTNFRTRVVKPLVFPPGDNVLETPVEAFKNENGSPAKMSEVKKWNLADEDKTGPTLIFRDIWLSDGTATNKPTGAPQKRAPAAGPARTGKYRIRGKVGTLEVDLILEPIDEPAAESTATDPQPPRESVVGQSDPARLERIRRATMPPIEKPISFDTPEADAICSALEVFPPDNPWNTVIEDWPVHPNSQNIVASAGVDKPFRCNSDMAFILVPPNQKPVHVKLFPYSNESDKGPYPVPDETPIEGWPKWYAGMTLNEVQRKIEKTDRHGIVVDPTNRMLYEFYQLRKNDSGWVASCSAIFDLKSNKLRRDGWTSTDAAGLPIFPAVVRYDELQRGIVEHAMRVTVVKTRKEYVYPARHFASSRTDVNLPRMGERLRLRKEFDISRFSPEAQAILKGLKKYGMFVADNGQDWAISVAPDTRMSNFAPELRQVTGADFEVVEPPPGFQRPK